MKTRGVARAATKNGREWAWWLDFWRLPNRMSKGIGEWFGVNGDRAGMSGFGTDQRRSDIKRPRNDGMSTARAGTCLRAFAGAAFAIWRVLQRRRLSSDLRAIKARRHRVLTQLRREQHEVNDNTEADGFHLTIFSPVRRFPASLAAMAGQKKSDGRTISKAITNGSITCRFEHIMLTPCSRSCAN